MLKPTRPVPRRCGGAPIPGRYKVESRDFAVEEVPAYEPSGAGEHLFLWVEKTGISTLDAVALLARALGRREREFGIAGLKDAQAVARQWVSIHGVDEARARGLSLDGVQVLEVRRHGNKLKLGHLRGNRFAVLIEGAGPEHADAARATLAALAAHGAPNYFGEQRFGKRGANVENGLRVLRADPRRAVGRMSRRLLNLLVSAVQSEVFNRVLISRLPTLDRLLDGDVAYLHRNGACFVVEDAAAEQPRCERFEISPSGPLPGPELLRARGVPGELEDAAMQAMALEPALFARMPRATHEGARRPLRVPVAQARVEVEARGLRLWFALPRGAYATSVLREVLADCPWFG